MNNSDAHEKLCDDVIFIMGSHPRIRAWKRKVGLAVPVGANRPVYYGIKGEADLQGIVAPHGISWAIEIKTGTGKLDKDQITWRDMFISFGGKYLLCRDVETALQFKENLLKV